MPTLPPPCEPRHYLSVPKALFVSLGSLSLAARDRLFQQALEAVQGRSRVLVCDAERRLLQPCHPARARELLTSRRARLLSIAPPLLQLRAVVTPAPAPDEETPT
ncbi:RRXRR domain-containing protein [Thiocystis violacea]|uniref:RRXRR domain-containing protein n=1 Tax=Thiocystis violacea TaxID=13725 RepID=UPI001907035E|nr:RRXRR domain-containing protein [Thiocystis violacea]MBK1717303.1 hypothetical protein [Thiocystis violacea]